MKTLGIVLIVIGITGLLCEVSMNMNCSQIVNKIKCNDKADIKSIKWSIS